MTAGGSLASTAPWPSEGAQEPESVFGGCFTLDVMIEQVRTRCLLDTGSEVTTMTETHFRQQFGAKRLSSATWVKLTAANGLDIPVVGCLYADVECLGMKLPGKCVFVVRDDPARDKEGSAVPGLLGMNILSELRTLFAGIDGIQKMDRHRRTAKSLNLNRIFAAIGREEQYCGEAIIEGHSRVPPKVNCQVLVEATPAANLPRGLMVANVLAHSTDGRVPVWLLNSGEQPVTLWPRSRLAELSKPCRVLPKERVMFEEAAGELRVKAISPGNAPPTGASSETTGPLSIPVQANLQGLDVLQVRQLNHLLEKHQAVFSQNDSDYGYTTTVAHSIPTGNAHPMKQRHRRVPPHVFQEVERHVQDLVEQGVLKESCSPWASPAVIVIKKDGSTEVKFLGHIVSAAGVQVDADKVKVLKDWAVPNSVKGMGVILG
ncbi:hypothetical protein SKAU_G00061670 [Synaphobranchus kaupii]|uniref:Peptidase A2 domain-containing protein n=1 Tax=Synaphobranchus kaupii TaxID=118154 RepID=A0A9Q1JAU5_SYNKA|nr:hypothetical protein SKAU_G00061670 [Synaphobranchus kaupii]